MAYLDFDTIKQAHRIEDVATQLSLKLKPHGAQLRGECFSGKGGERALVITPAKQAWYSFGINKGGDVIALVSHVKGIPPKEAAEWLQGDTQPEKKKPEKAEEVDEPKERGFRELDYLQYDHEAVVALGFDPEFAKTVGLGYAPRGVMRGTVAIPVRSSNGNLLGYIGVTDAKLPSNWHI